MRTIEQQIFPYSELSTKAQQRVHNDYVSNIDSGWHEHTLEDAQQIAVYLGFHMIKICYTGFSSQGDGACFQGGWHRNTVDRPKLKSHAPIDEELHGIAEELAKAPDGLRIAVEHTGNYYHENSMRYTYDCIGLTDEVQVDEDTVEAAFKRFAKWIYRQLETEYSRCISLEAFEEQEADSGNEYYEDGRLYTGD